MKCVGGGWRRGLFIALEVGFPPTHIWKVIRCLGSHSSSKCTWTGTRLGSADLGGRLTHLAASRPDLLLDGIFFDPYPYPLVHLAWRPRFLRHVGPLCKGVTLDVIFCIVIWCLLCVFVLFHSCSSEMYKTPKQLWSKVSDTNM